MNSFLPSSLPPSHKPSLSIWGVPSPHGCISALGQKRGRRNSEGGDPPVPISVSFLSRYSELQVCFDHPEFTCPVSANSTLMSLWQITPPLIHTLVEAQAQLLAPETSMQLSRASGHRPHSAIAQPRHNKYLGRKRGPRDLESQEDEAGAVAAIWQPRGKNLSNHRKEKELRDNAGKTGSC